jgi:hypothetical protein
MNQIRIRLIGWSAYGNALLMLANMVTLGLMFTVSPLWGPVNDAVSVLWMLSFLPLAVLLARVNQQVMGRAVAGGIALLGAVAMLLFALLQGLLFLRIVGFEQTFATIVTLGGIVGLWLLLNGVLALKGKTLPSGLAWLTVVFGLSYILGTVGFWLGGYEQPLLWLGAALGYLLGPVWAFWLGRLVMKRHTSISSEACVLPATALE